MRQSQDVNFFNLPKSIKILYVENQLKNIDKVIFTRNQVVNPTIYIYINGEIHNYCLISDKWLRTDNVVKGVNNKQAETFIVNICKLPKQISENYSLNDRKLMLEVSFISGKVLTIYVVFSFSEIQVWELANVEINDWKIFMFGNGRKRFENQLLGID